jgi:signal transduction histidine kinase
VVAVGAFVNLLRDPLNHDLSNLAGAIAWYVPVVSVLITGMYIRTRRLYVGELRDRAERAERGREERARVAVAEERGRIARELHDAVRH